MRSRSPFPNQRFSNLGVKYLSRFRSDLDFQVAIAVFIFPYVVCLTNRKIQHEEFDSRQQASVPALVANGSVTVFWENFLAGPNEQCAPGDGAGLICF